VIRVQSPFCPFLLSLFVVVQAIAWPTGVALSSEEAARWWLEAQTATDAERSLEAYSRIIREAASDSMVGLARLERLKGLYALGRVEQALAEWGEWRTTDPDVLENGARLYWYSLALMETENIGQAASLIEETLARNGVGGEKSARSSMLKELLIACHLELDEPERAAELAMEMVRHTTSDDLMPLLLYDLARAHEAGGSYDKAQETWKLLRDSYPSTPEATYAEAEVDSPEQVVIPLAEEYPAEEDNETRYRLFVRSFRNRAQAAELSERVEELGIPVQIDELEAPSGSLFSVVAGPFLGERAAGQMKRELISMLEIPGIVVIEEPEGE
jgi:tetratricopeptide (TPR) repeat protein